MKIDLKLLTPVVQLEGEDGSELRQMAKEAADYLKKFKWCGSITDSYFGMGVPAVVGVFLFQIVPAKPNADSWVWVIVGDLPSAYIAVDNAPNAACALDCYIGEMREWVHAVKKGEPIADKIPVNTLPTLNNAKALESRLEFLSDRILSHYSDDLKC